MTYTPDVIVPKWVRELDKSKCVQGRVYNIYECRTCILPNEADQKRKGRKSTKMKNGVVTAFTRCACWERKPILMKYKKCCCCGTEVYGIKIQDGRCNRCTRLTKYKNYKYIDTEPMEKILELYKFYRMGKSIESNKDLSKDSKWDCLNRCKCLESCFIPGGSSIKLGCVDCPQYIKTCL